MASRRSLRRRSSRFPSPEGDDQPSFPRSSAVNRKDLQLCRQVAEALHLLLGDCGDDILRDLHVVQVLPAPDATQLLVIVGAAPGDTPPDPGSVLERLQARSGMLRAGVAAAITRKRAPALLFEYAVPRVAEDDR